MENTETLTKQTNSERKTKFLLSYQDITEGMSCWRLWLLLGWQDIQHRYRRSVLGPIWLTLSMAVMIYSLGFIYGHLFKMNLTEYFPHVAVGMLIWNFIGSTVLEMTDAFIECAHYIKQIKLPFSTYILRILVRNFIILGHNFVALIPILIYYKTPVNPFPILLGLILISVIGFTFGFVFAMLGARYRDMKPILQNVLNLLFYITPIMWMPQMLPERFAFVAKYNPLNQLIEMIRAPLIGNTPALEVFVSTSLLASIGIVLMTLMLVRARHRIAFWV